MATAPSTTDERTGDRYYTHPTGAKCVSVTTVTSGTTATPYLAPWGSKVTYMYAAKNLPLLLDIYRTQGEDALVKHLRAESTKRRDLKRDVGSYVHAVIENLILWAASPKGEGRNVMLPDLPDHLHGTYYDDDPVEKVADWMYTGFTNFMSDWGPDILAAEMSVFNLPLGYGGTLDLILAILGRKLLAGGMLGAAPGQRFVPCVDIKTGKNYERTWPEQLAATSVHWKRCCGSASWCRCPPPTAPRRCGCGHPRNSRAGTGSCR